MQLTGDQMRTIDCLFRWLEIRGAAGHTPPSSVDDLRAAALHSALLRRLLAGEDPLPDPPPLSFGQPWYELVEQGHAICVVQRNGDGLLINSTRWQVIEEHGADELIVSPQAGQATYLLWKLPALSSGESASRDWIIERIWSAPS